MAAVILHVEVISYETGLWCSTCALSSGVRITLSTRASGRLALALNSVRRCLDCGGDEVE